ncbi:PREDICTED: interleukin-6 [Dipodomys ordii]|uniref:Interleukin-6 n=1 Tax=Dipodomys ordii TaxID=10020 RepID=A0A1S3FSW2_DIPOR|nr:PREDICTED: interleukin-6 [Dipodomys ordii]
MKFLSTSTFCPLAFVGLLLVTATAFPTSEVPREEVTSNATSDGPTYASTQNAEDQISYTLMKIKELKEEVCNNEEKCVRKDNALSEEKLNLPKMTVEDGCFESGHKRDTCLLKITSGLLEFQIYLKYIQNKFQSSEKNNKAKDVKSSTKSVIQLLMQEIKNQDEIVFPSPTANALLLKELESQNEWQKNMIIHLILSSLETFLQFSLRALRIL